MDDLQELINAHLAAWKNRVPVASYETWEQAYEAIEDGGPHPQELKVEAMGEHGVVVYFEKEPPAAKTKPFIWVEVVGGVVYRLLGDADFEFAVLDFDTKDVNKAYVGDIQPGIVEPDLRSAFKKIRASGSSAKRAEWKQAVVNDTTKLGFDEWLKEQEASVK